MSVWQINFEKDGTVGTFMKMTFNGSKKYSDASGNNLSGLCLEDMHLCPGRNGASGKEGDAAIAFTAPSTGTYTLVVTMDRPGYLGSLVANSYPRFYTQIGQDGSEENVFEYTNADNSALTKTIEVQLKAGETFYFASDARGSRVSREHDVRLKTFKVTYTSTNYTVNEDTEPDVDDNNNPGTSDYVCSVAVLAAVCGVGVLAKKKQT